MQLRSAVVYGSDARWNDELMLGTGIGDDAPLVWTKLLFPPSDMSAAACERWVRTPLRFVGDVGRIGIPLVPAAADERREVSSTTFARSRIRPCWEGVKFALKLRAFTTSARLILAKVNMTAGHGGASGRYDALEERAFDIAFLLDQLGIVGEAAIGRPDEAIVPHKVAKAEAARRRLRFG